MIQTRTVAKAAVAAAALALIAGPARAGTDEPKGGASPATGATEGAGRDDAAAKQSKKKGQKKAQRSHHRRDRHGEAPLETSGAAGTSSGTLGRGPASPAGPGEVDAPKGGSELPNPASPGNASGTGGTPGAEGGGSPTK